MFARHLWLDKHTLIFQDPRFHRTIKRKGSPWYSPTPGPHSLQEEVFMSAGRSLLGLQKGSLDTRRGSSGWRCQTIFSVLNMAAASASHLSPWSFA